MVLVLVRAVFRSINDYLLQVCRSLSSRGVGGCVLQNLLPLRATKHLHLEEILLNALKLKFT